jgi:hypothetical protein
MRKGEEIIKERVERSVNKLLSQQMAIAQGLTFLYVIETKSFIKDGKKVTRRSKPKIVKDEDLIADYLAGDLDNDENEYYFMATQRPDNKAIDSLLNRAYGRQLRRQ